MSELAGGFVAVLAVSLLAAAFWPPAGQAANARLTRDTYTSSATPTTNFGRGQALRVAAAGGERTWIRFSVSDALPPGTPGSQIAKAILRPWVSNTTTPQAQGPFAVHVVLRHWTETGITHANAPALDPPPVASNINMIATRNTLDIDITGLVRNWHDGVVANEGVVLTAAPGFTAAGGFDSRENTATSHAPELEVTLAGATGEGIPGPQGPPGPGAPVCAESRVRSPDFTATFSFTCPSVPTPTFLLGAECVNRVTLLLQPLTITGNTATCAGGGDRNLRVTCCAPRP